MVHYKNSQPESLPYFGPDIEVIRRIPDDEFKKSKRESLPYFGPNIEVIRRIPDDEFERFGGYETSSQHSEISRSEAFWNSLKHGLSFNLDDEIAGITAAGRGSDDQLAIIAFLNGLYNYWTGDKKTIEKYEKEANRLRDYYRRMSDQHYWTSLFGNALGSAIPSLVTLGGGALASGARFVAPTLARNLAESKLGQAFLKAGQSPTGRFVSQYVSPFLGIANKTTAPHLLKVGAASGALQGAGEGEGLGNTITSTLSGAGLGVGGALAGSVLAHFSGYPVSGIRRLFSPSRMEGVEKKTLRAISKHLDKEASEELGESFKNAVLNDYVTDHSPFLKDLVFDIAGRNQGAYLDLIKRAQERALGGGKRIHQAADKHFVQPFEPRQNVTDLKGNLIASREASSHTLYEIAKKTPIGEQYYGALNELMKRPYFKQAYKEGLQDFTSAGKEVSSFSSQEFNLLKEKPNMGVLHKTKEALDEMMNIEKQQGRKRKIHTLVGIQKKLLEVMDDISPAYKKARSLYHQYSSRVDAINEGSKILSKSVNKDEFSRIFDALPKAQQEYLKSGSRGEFLQGITKTKDKVSKAKEIFDTDNLYDRFAKIYGTDKAYAVKKVVDKEADYADFFNRIPNHKAGEEISFTHNVSIPTSERDAAMQLGRAAVKASWIPFKEAASRERQRIEKDVVKLLTGGTQITNDQIVDLIQRMVKAHHNGYATKEWFKKLSAALFGGGGKGSTEDLNVLSAFE